MTIWETPPCSPPASSPHRFLHVPLVVWPLPRGGRALLAGRDPPARPAPAIGSSLAFRPPGGWAGSGDINAYNGDEPTEKLPFPIIDDKNRDLAIQLGMLDPAEKDEKGMPVTARVVFIFGPDKKLKLSILYPATTGRNFDEILRVIISLQLTAEKRVATPVDWKNGDSVMVLPTIPEEEAKKLFPKGVFTKELPSGKKYLRYTPQP
ncbi:Peroxiredoxin-6, partial [Eschrichtius robustus]|nr:Peroxiredoxin-6 [Eschrichtius robustus]